MRHEKQPTKAAPTADTALPPWRAAVRGGEPRFCARIAIDTPNLVLRPGDSFPAAWSSKETLDRFSRIHLQREDATWRDVAVLQYVQPIVTPNEGA